MSPQGFSGRWAFAYAPTPEYSPCNPLPLLALSSKPLCFLQLSAEVSLPQEFFPLPVLLSLTPSSLVYLQPFAFPHRTYQNTAPTCLLVSLQLTVGFVRAGTMSCRMADGWMDG